MKTMVKMCNVLGIIGLVAGSVLGDITSDFANPPVQFRPRPLLQPLFSRSPTPFLPVSEPHFSPSCARTRKSNFSAVGTTVADIGGTNGFGAQITTTNLNAGTTTGTWNVNQAQNAPGSKAERMIQRERIRV